MAQCTVVSQPTLVFVIPLMAGMAAAVGKSVLAGNMAVLAGDYAVHADERKFAEVVIKLAGALPALGVMTAAALCHGRIIVDIITAVTAAAITGQLFV